VGGLAVNGMELTFNRGNTDQPWPFIRRYLGRGVPVLDGCISGATDDSYCKVEDIVTMLMTAGDSQVGRNPILFTTTLITTPPTF
jgi:hypothetical protein